MDLLAAFQSETQKNIHKIKVKLTNIMEKKIAAQYISTFTARLKGIKKPVPFLSVAPRCNNANNAIGIIFFNGLNGTKAMVSYLNYPVFEDKWLFTFDNRGQGDNTNFASNNYRKYVRDAQAAVAYLIDQHPAIAQWYLIGESWGSAIISLVAKAQLHPKVAGLFFWNMPCRVVNADPRSGWGAIKNILKVLTTLLFFIPLKTDNPFNRDLINNPVLAKAITIFSKQTINVGTIVACGKSFRPAWRYLIKNQANLNLRYVQSGDDILKDLKQYNRLKAQTPAKTLWFAQGHHILSFDKIKGKDLFLELAHFIQTSAA